MRMCACVRVCVCVRVCMRVCMCVCVCVFLAGRPVVLAFIANMYIFLF